MKIKLNSLGAFMLVVIMGGMYFNSLTSVQNGSDLLIKNVEALSEGDIISETTWQCSGKKKDPCGAACGNCRAYVKGTGKLEGEHRCISAISPSDPILPPPPPVDM